MNGKWLVVYSSNTGNTKKVAEAMFGELPEGSQINSVKEEIHLDDADIVAVGYWVTRGGPEPMTRELLPKITGKKVILFQTMGADIHSEHAVTSLARAAYLLGDSCEIIGTFSCRGEINSKLLEARKKLPPTNPHYPNERNKKRWEAAKGHPDQADLERAREFIMNMQRKLVMMEKYRKAAKK